MDIVEMVWQALQDEIDSIKADMKKMSVQSEQAEVAENVPASTLAAAPLAADGGLADGVNFASLRFIANGRKPGEGAGAGTGILCFYNASADAWWTVSGNVAVTT